MTNISNELQELYNNYYDKNTNKKRVLSALDSVREILNISKSIKYNNVLDVGSGDGSVIEELENWINEKIFSVEISDSGIETIKKRKLKQLVDVKKFNGYTIPYSKNSFDLSLSTYVLEHVEHERLFLREISRVSKYSIISVPLENTIFIKKSLKFSKKIGHINFYNKDTFENLLNSSGLKVLDIYCYTTSLQYEIHCSPKLGRIKYYIRKYSLKFFPKIASLLFTYMCIALCKSKT